jgi:hypothetical protein
MYDKTIQDNIYRYLRISYDIEHFNPFSLVETRIPGCLLGLPGRSFALRCDCVVIALSCLVLRLSGLAGLVLSCLVWSGLVLSCLVSSYFQRRW